VHADAVLFLDDDCEMLSDCVPAVVDAFNFHPDAVALECAVRFPHATTTKAQIMRTIFWRGYFDQLPIKRPNGLQVRTVAGCAMAFRTTLFALEKFDEHLNDYAIGEDWEFAKRAQRYGTMWRVSTARVHHHVAPTNRYKADRSFHERWANFMSSIKNTTPRPISETGFGLDGGSLENRSLR